MACNRRHSLGWQLGSLLWLLLLSLGGARKNPQETSPWSACTSTVVKTINLTGEPKCGTTWLEVVINTLAREGCKTLHHDCTYAQAMLKHKHERCLQLARGESKLLGDVPRLQV